MPRTLAEMMAEPNSHLSVGYCLPRDCVMICDKRFHYVYPGMKVKSEGK